MSALRQHVISFIQQIESGQSLAAMREFYAEDVVIFENRDLTRAGREQCIAYEQAALKSLPQEPVVKALRFAVDEATGNVFIEWRIRFVSKKGRPMRLEEIAAQRWERGKISEERFYYEGFVDEGDMEEVQAFGTA